MPPYEQKSEKRTTTPTEYSIQELWKDICKHPCNQLNKRIICSCKACKPKVRKRILRTFAKKNQRYY